MKQAQLAAEGQRADPAPREEAAESSQDVRSRASGRSLQTVRLGQNPEGQSVSPETKAELTRGAVRQGDGRPGAAAHTRIPPDYTHTHQHYIHNTHIIHTCISPDHTHTHTPALHT